MFIGASHSANQSLEEFLKTEVYLVTALSHRLFARIIIRHDGRRDEVITLAFTTEQKAKDFLKIARDRKLVSRFNSGIRRTTLREFNRWESEGIITTDQLALDLDLHENPSYQLSFR
jgi:hypothetical protein